MVFSEKYLDGEAIFLHHNFFFKKPNFLECGQVLVVTWVKLDCFEDLLLPGPGISLKSTGKQGFQERTTNIIPQHSMDIVTYKMDQIGANLFKIFLNLFLFNLSCVICHVSAVTCDLSVVTNANSHRPSPS